MLTCTRHANNRLAKALVLFAVLGTGSALPCAAQSFNWNTISIPNSGNDDNGDCATAGVNDAGLVVGSYQSTIASSDGFYHFHGFSAAGGQITVIDPPGSIDTAACGVNNSGQIVGAYVTFSTDIAHGFLLSGGQFSTIDVPVTGERGTEPSGINNYGEIVGTYFDQSFGAHGFLFAAGAFSTIDFPGATNTSAYGINDFGDVVGTYADSLGDHGFLLSGGSFTTIEFPGGPQQVGLLLGINNARQIVGYCQRLGTGFIWKAGQFTSIYNTGDLSNSSTFTLGINNFGWLTGVYPAISARPNVFLATVLALVDPVPDLLDGPTVVSASTSAGAQLLATKGRPVQGVAADGATQVVLRVPVASAGDQIAVTVLSDQQQPPVQSNLPDEDGALGIPGQTAFSQTQIVATAVNTGTGPNGANAPFAFIVYRAPKDFARLTTSGGFKSGSCNGVTNTDDQQACRTVTVQVQDLTAGTPVMTVAITIVRPLVVFIHGMWSDWTSWNNFAPLTSASGADPRFTVTTVSYNVAVGPVISSVPALGSRALSRIRGNALGFQYNTAVVASGLNTQLQSFNAGLNIVSVPVASVQVDVVGHSMGGDITRTLALQPDYLLDSNFAQGSVHKLITIDTPHDGSPLATQLLTNASSCFRGFLAAANLRSLSSITLSDGTIVSGAVGDLAGNPFTGVYSPAIQALVSPTASQPQIPTVLIGGEETRANTEGLSGNMVELAIVDICGPGDPLAANLTPGGWDQNFAPDGNDAIVGIRSQLAGGYGNPIPGGALITLPASLNGVGQIHTAAIEPIGFVGPSVLDPNQAAFYVISALNVPITHPGSFGLLN